MERFAYASIIVISLACIFGGTAQAQIFIDQWGMTSQGKAWPIHWNESYPAGNVGIGNGARPTGWASIRGGFDPITLTTDNTITVSGKMELIGGSAASAYTWLRYALTYQANSTLNYLGTDSAIWISTQNHYGYEFTPRTGTGTMARGAGGSGTVWTVSDGNWNSTWSNNGKPISAIDQTPYDAVAEAGMYNWAISVRSINDTLNEIKWYLNEINNMYCIGGTIIDTTTTKIFNGICFCFNNDIEATSVNFYEVKVDFDGPIIIPPVPWQAYHIDKWGKTSQGKAWPIHWNESYPAGNTGIGNGARPAGWATIRGGFEPVTITTDSAIIVSGKMEFIGGGGASAYTWLRYALTFLDSTTLQYRGTDSAFWDSPQKHYGYAFHPKSGIGTMAGGLAGLGNVYTVFNGSWSSTWSNGGKGKLAYVLQYPKNAIAIAGIYNWAVSVRSVNDTLNEIRWYLIEQDNKYWWGGMIIDTATTKKFNGVCFGFNNDMEATQVNFYDVKVDRGEPIIVPEPLFQPFYVDQWGKTAQGKAWPITWNDSTTLAGDAGIGNDASPTGWATIRGGFDPVTITSDSAIIVSGKMEFIGDPGDSAYTWLRYALTYQDSSVLYYHGTDSAIWISSKTHYGYEFTPRTGTGTMANGNGGAGTVWTVLDGNWISTWSNGGKGPIAAAMQAPRNAVAITGIYNWAISVRSINDTLNEIKWYLIEQNNKYWFGGTVIDISTTKKFNGICFGFNNDCEATRVNFYEVKVDKNLPPFPPPPKEPFYIDEWGIIGSRYGGWTFKNTELVGNATLSGSVPNSSWTAIRGGFYEPIISPSDKDLVVSGKIEFKGGGFEAANSFRYGIFYSDSAGHIDNTSIDSTHWTGSEDYHSGYLFIPPSGANTPRDWSVNDQKGTWGAVVSNLWFGTSGVNNYVLGSEMQNPLNAVPTAGMYDFAIAVRALSDTSTQIQTYLVKADNSYSLIINAIDSHKPLAVNKFNCVAFILDSGNITTEINLYDVLVSYNSPFIPPSDVKESKDELLPLNYFLSQNYPNPFNPTTQIKFSIPHNSNVTLIVYNLLGQKVATLFDGIYRPGDYEAIFDGSRLASGIYFYRLKANNTVFTKKLVLIK